MKLTDENYYSKQADFYFCSASQYKSAIGCIGRLGCEERMLAELKGKWDEPMSVDMLIGGYVDARYEGTIEKYMGQHPELFVTRGERKGELKKDFIFAEEIYKRCERDPLFSGFMSGEKQVIMTGEIEGVPFKIKMDSLLPGKAIVDLKIMQSINKVFWAKDYGHMDFIQYWGYDIQLAIYQEIYRQNTGEILPTFIAVADKGKYPDINVIYVDNYRLAECLEDVKRNAPRVQMLKRGEIEPLRCNSCDYCKSTKVLSEPIHYSTLIGDI
jgi:hypothetical protein